MVLVAARTMLGLIWLIHVLLMVRVPAKLPSKRLRHLVVYNDELVLISSQDLGFVAVERGEKMIIRYPVDSSYFSRTKLKIKLAGDD